MAAMSSPKTSPSDLFLSQVTKLAKEVKLLPGDTYYWSPKTKTISFITESLATPKGRWSLLHEVAHAQLHHTTYKSDFELLKLEVAAWQEAKILGQRLDVEIDENYIQDCIDTYRDWLHQRSTCPTCGSIGLQHNPKEYRCHNCLSVWQVSESRFCRPYRRKKISTKEKSPGSVKNQATFR